MRFGVAAAALACALAAAKEPAVAAEGAGPYDLVLRNGRVVDGTGSAWFRADVAIRGDSIARIAPRIEAPATREIDVKDQVISPGFVDLHTYPAQRIGISDRGLLRPGLKADIAVFDPALVRDPSTYDAPHQYAVGFSHVIVNGAVEYEDGKMTAARPGRVLHGPARK